MPDLKQLAATWSTILPGLNRSTAAPPKTVSLQVDGEMLAFLFIRTSRNRRMSLRVTSQGEVIVRAPLRMSMREAAQFVTSNAAWIRSRRQITRNRLDSRRALCDGILLPLLDGQLCLRLHSSVNSPKRGKVQRTGDELHVYSDCHERDSIVPLLEDWYREYARIYMSERLAALGDRLNLRAGSLSIRSQKTRWGSCSPQGAISMNWRLMLAPAALLDYVLIHELCHLRHMNHSVQFWTLVGQFEPDYLKQRSLLRKLQATLVI